MRIQSLYLRNFRNYEEAYFEFSPRFNLIHGANAQGKTTILEALHYLMIGRSFRTQKSDELVKKGTDSFYIEAIFSKHGVEQSLKISYQAKERKIVYNNTPLQTVSGLLGIVSGVVMTPDDAGLVKGAPLLRRQFLDLQLAQVDPLYVHHLSRYSKAIRQRNWLLKAQQTTTLDSWEQEMSHSAAYISSQRHKTIQNLQPRCQAFHQVLTSDTEQLGLIYDTASPCHLSLEELQEFQNSQYKKYRTRELVFGYTLVGPQKDDLSFTIDGKEVKQYASEGQQRSYVTAVRFAEWDLLHQRAQEKPLMIIDDLGLCLDPKRQQQLMKMLENTEQIFVTTTDETLYDKISIPKKQFSIHKGQVQS